MGVTLDLLRFVMSDMEQQPLTADSPAVMKYLDMYQGIINRMAGNSADCKKWAVALVSAILVLTAREKNADYAAFVVVPAVVFWFLDTYYLALEKQFRDASGSVVKALHKGELYSESLYVVRADGKLPKTFVWAMTSWSVWPFYLGMLLLVAGVKWII